MHTATILEVTVGVLTLLGGLTGIIFAAGRTLGKFTSVVDENARAVKGLAEALDRMGTKFDAREQRMDDKHDDLDHRVTVVETKLKVR